MALKLAGVRGRVPTEKERLYRERACLMICFLLTIGIQLWVLFPLQDRLVGDDSVYHYLRVDAVANRLRYGTILSEISHVFFEGAGYADFANPVVLLYIPALFRLMGCGIGLSMSLFLILCDVFTYLAVYVSVKDISRRPIAAAIAAMLYSLSMYRFDSLFTRFALGEVLAFMFWPLVLWGLYDLIARDGKRLWILGVGLGGMLLCHSLSTLLACVVCVVFCLCFIKRILSDKAKRKRLLLTAGFTLALTAFYWVPFLRFVIQHDLTLFYPNTIAAENTVDPLTMFSNVRIDATHAGIGVILLVAGASRILLTSRSPLGAPIRQAGVHIRFLDVCLLTGVVTLFCATDLAPWKVLGVLLNSLQFSFRLYAIVTVCLAMAGGICLYYVLHAAKATFAGVAIVCVACVLGVVLHCQVIEPRHRDSPPDDYFYTTSASRIVCNGEWLPIKAKKAVKSWETQTDLLELSDGTRPTFTRAGGVICFPVDEPCEYADVPLVWYHDYTAVTQSGEECPVTDNEQGLVRVDVTGVSGEVTVFYKVSFVTKAAYAVSFITALGLAGILILPRVRRRNAAKKEKTPIA